MCIMCQYIVFIHILHIKLKYAVQNRALLDTLCLHPSNNNRGYIVLYSTLLMGHTEHAGQMRISSLPFVPKKSKGLNRQDMVFVHPPGILTGLFSWGWITSGSANFCSYSKFIQGQTHACSTVSVRMFLCWKSTLGLGNQVIFCIFCIFCIF